LFNNLKTHNILFQSLNNIIVIDFYPVCQSVCKIFETYNKKCIVAGIIIVLLTFLIGVVYFRQRRNLRKQVFESQKAKKKFSNVYTLVDIHEKERVKMAQRLHEDISGNLTALKLKLEIQNKRKDDLIDILDKTLTNLREVSYLLAPPVLQQYNLIEAIRQYIETLSFDILFYSNGTFPVNVSLVKETAIYRILQELIDNIVEHSKGTGAFIRINSLSNALVIDVEDNGVGFDVRSMPKGMGLDLVFFRIDLLDADIKFYSDENGTKVHIKIENLVDDSKLLND